MAFIPVIYKNWKDGRVNGYQELPAFDNHEDAEKALITALDEFYPTLWRTKFGQYIHVRGQAGDHVLAMIQIKISERERIDQELAKIEEHIADLIEERERLLIERQSLK
jgi:hypothetical protein